MNMEEMMWFVVKVTVLLTAMFIGYVLGTSIELHKHPWEVTKEIWRSVWKSNN